MEKDPITTIQLRSSTRDRLYKMKFRKTYDDYIIELMDIVERLEREGNRKRRDPEKLAAMMKATKEWADRNVKWKDGKMVGVDLDGK
jgi:hypothetical protein